MEWVKEKKVDKNVDTVWQVMLLRFWVTQRGKNSRAEKGMWAQSFVFVFLNRYELSELVCKLWGRPCRQNRLNLQGERGPKNKSKKIRGAGPWHKQNLCSAIKRGQRLRQSRWRGTWCKDEVSLEKMKTKDSPVLFSKSDVIPYN